MLLLDFLKWYYYEAPMEVLAIWRNFLAFSFDFFGVRYHLATLFRPWHLIVVRFNEEDRIKGFFFNLASRIIGSVIGVIMRSGAIFTGLLSFFVFFVLGIGVELLWLTLPFFLGYFFLQGFYLLL